MKLRTPHGDRHHDIFLAPIPYFQRRQWLWNLRLYLCYRVRLPFGPDRSQQHQRQEAILSDITMSTATQTQTQTIESYELENATRWEQAQQGPRSGPDSSPNDTPPENAATSTFAQLDRATWFKLISACFSFLVAGVNDGSVGALIPYIIRDYKVNTAIVSGIYGATFAGWLVAAVTNTHLCQYLKLGSMLSLGAAIQILGHVLRVWRPPFGLFVVTFFLTALGQAFNDTHANTYVAGTKGAHRWLALIHASYMAGCLVGPFVATAIASSTPRWYLFYAFLVGIGVLNQGFIAWAFRDTLSIVPKETAGSESSELGQTGGNTSSRNKDAAQLIKQTLTRRSVLLLSLFYFFYIGSAITLGGWVVEYLVEVRDGDLSKMGFVPAGFNVRLSRIWRGYPSYQTHIANLSVLYALGRFHAWKIAAGRADAPLW